MAALHHKPDTLQFGDVGGWISFDRHQVSKLAWLDRPDSVAPSHKICGFDRGRANRLERSHTELHHVLEFLGLGAMWEGAHPRPERDLHALRHSPRKAALRDFRHAVAPILFHVVLSVQLIVIKRGHKIDAFLQHYLDVGIFKVYTVFDGIDPGVQTVAKAFSSEGVAGNLAAFLVSLVHNRVDFFGCEGGGITILPSTEK